MFELFTSILSGGMTGLFGVAVQRFADYKNKQLDIQILDSKQKHESNLRQLDAQIMEKEWAGRTRVSEVEAESRIEVADSLSFKESFKEERIYSNQLKVSKKQSWLFVGLDFLRGIIRPGLTIYLCVITTLVYFQAQQMTTGISHEQALEVVKMVISTILYLTTTCLLWWFGVRNRGKNPGT